MLQSIYEILLSVFEKKFEFISALFLSDFNCKKTLENERNAQPEWLNNMDSNESEFSGFSEDEIDSNRAYSLENDDSGQSGSESEQEDGPDERWIQGPSFRFLDQYLVLMLFWGLFSTLLPCLSF